MTWRSQWLAAAWAIGTVGPVAAADGARIVGESRRTVQRFVEADRLTRDGQINAAVDLYLRIIQEAGDELVAGHSSGQHLAPARWLAHRRIVGDGQLLAKFRDRVAGSAKKLLADGLATRDAKPLHQLVDSSFGARETEAALHMLGDLACERGEFPAARRFWSVLIPNPTIDTLHYPTAPENLALPRAKLILCRMLNADSAGLSEVIAKLEQQYPESIVTLAGRTGKIGHVLRELAGQTDLAVPVSTRSHEYIATYSGDESRNGLVRMAMPLPEPTERNTAAPMMDSISSPNSVGRQSPRLSDASLVAHPIITGRHAFVADTRRVVAIDLVTRRLAAQFDLQSQVEFVGRSPAPFDNRVSVTLAGDNVYARLGQAATRGDRIEPDSYIAALQFQPGANEPLRLRWLLPAGGPDRVERAVFEGAPIVHDGRLFVAATRMEGNRAITAVAGYDPAGAAPTLMWQHDAIDASAESAERAANLLLCAADGFVICGPLNGAIVAFEANTGRRAWAYQYPLDTPSNARRQSPCVATDGKVIAAPADSDRAIALDLASGTLLWQSDPLRVEHVLGVASGRVVCQTSGGTAGIRAIDVSTGRLLPHWGHEVFGSDAAAPFGRGLLFEDCVCWPTRAEGFKILRLDGLPEIVPAILQSQTAGNLAYASGRFVIAGPTQLQVLETDRTTAAAVNREAP